MQCNCEHEDHGHGCTGKAERVRFTCYGAFELCGACYEAGHMDLEKKTYKAGRDYRGPSVKAMIEGLRIDKSKAQELKGLMRGLISPNTYLDVHAWKKQCFNPPPRIERLLCALNQVLGTYGTEVLHSKHSGGGFWQGVRFVYLNAGDTYASTLIYDTELEYFRLGSWGDLVEAGRYGLE